MTLKITDLSKRLDDGPAVRSISLEVNRGEILGLFGRSGDGKSVLMRVIAGIEPADGGSVFFESTDLTSKSFQERGIVFPGSPYDAKLKSPIAGEIADQFSGGIRQAAELDEALLRAAGLLLLDNQFCLMDPSTRESKIRQLRQTVQDKNLAVVFSTNDFEEIFMACDKVAVLSNGEIVQTGTPRNVYERPVSSAAARITGRNNLIVAKRLASSTSEVSEYQTIDGGHRLFTDNAGKDEAKAADHEQYLAIRPEHISISFGASFPEDNLLKAEISEIVYQGATTIINLNANGLRLQALVLRLVGLSVGDECMVGLPPDRILVLDK